MALTIMATKWLMGPDAVVCLGQFIHLFNKYVWAPALCMTPQASCSVCWRYQGGSRKKSLSSWSWRHRGKGRVYLLSLTYAKPVLVVDGDCRRGLPREGWHFPGLVPWGLPRGEKATSPKSGVMPRKPHREPILKSLPPPFIDADWKGAQLEQELDFPSILAAGSSRGEFDLYTIPSIDNVGSPGPRAGDNSQDIFRWGPRPDLCKGQNRKQTGVWKSVFVVLFLTSLFVIFIFSFPVEILTAAATIKAHFHLISGAAREWGRVTWWQASDR